jgi:hypothetical protein
MSDNGEWLEHYGGSTEDEYDDELPDTASVEEMKEKERAILCAERKVDAQVRDLCGTELRRPCLYEHGTRAWQVRCAVEDEDMEDEDMNEERTLHKVLKIEKADNFLDVVSRDMKQIKDEFEMDMKFMEKMKRFRSNLSSAVATGAGVANTDHECMQDTAAMERMISVVRTIKDYELGLRKRLFSEITKARNIMCDEDTSDEDE